MKGCNWLANRAADRLVLAAFKQACAEAGIPEHPGGKCPTPDCKCRDLADQVEDRAIQIIEEKLGHALPPGCGRCGNPVAKPGETGADGLLSDRALWCDSCIDRCHEATDFAHVCQLCATPEEARRLGYRTREAMS